ncbi:hypothetical protein SR914_00870 [Comamonas testosteroni]|uniref:Uncharacterized protein n=1 Tax=Comamonas testosteroni (strain DSM 14576 / KF-1) TaxID=399795 RepID=B7WRW7_COMTK|nr:MULTISPECIES: hypothetical protein [Comamonas]EED69021.1 conserved hypothetical protein [Comamonas testosteroni KF-1]NIF83918.1 hypothetical protein [Comamonas sp. Tr-654]WQG67011.1 hypothetical protein SR914_00870 [Comamonas testosteroni]
MNDFAATATRWAVRIMLMLVGLVFFLCLMAVACLIALAWGVRALWARLTGQPVVPMSMGAMSPFAGWQTVYRSGAEWMAQSSGNADAKKDGRETRGRRGVLPGTGDVTDVQPREVHES